MESHAKAQSRKARKPTRELLAPLRHCVTFFYNVHMQPPVFRTKRRIEFGDTDMAGIVHFANFFRFMESAECEFLRSRGLSVKLDWEGQAIGFPRVSASCDYIQPARFEDLLDVAVSIDRIGTKS